MRLIAIFLFVYLNGTSGMCSEPHFNLLKKKEVISQDNTNGTDELYRKVLKSNSEIKDILNRKSSIPVIWDGSKNINTGKIYRGILLNSIVSTNLSSPLIVKAHSNQGLKVNTRFVCQGVTKHKRVHTACTKMISESEERKINAQLLNLDGTAGLIGEYDSNKESLIAGAVLNSFSQGMLSVAGDRVQTNLGAIDSNTLKNQAISGLITGADTTNNLIQDEINNSEPIVTINAGAEVLIYFLEAPIEN